MELNLTKGNLNALVEDFSDLSTIGLVARDCLTLHAEVERLEKVENAAKSLMLNLPDFILDELRDLWGNTNVNVVQHWEPPLPFPILVSNVGQRLHLCCPTNRAIHQE